MAIAARIALSIVAGIASRIAVGKELGIASSIVAGIPSRIAASIGLGIASSIEAACFHFDAGNCQKFVSGLGN